MKDAAETLIKDTENVLKRINMNIKGWAISGEIPPEQMTDDGFSVNFSGLKWYPVLDAYKSNISSLHFKKKKRGKHDSNVDMFDVDGTTLLAQLNLLDGQKTSRLYKIVEILCILDA